MEHSKPGQNAGSAGSGISADTYWARISACGITKIRKHSPTRWLCRRVREGEVEFPIYVEDPDDFTPEQREAMIEAYRQRYGGFDC